MQMDPEGIAPEDLSHAGSVVDKAIEYMMEQQIQPISIASALLGGALGVLTRTLDDRAVAGELRRQPPKLFVCGHSHICLVRFDPDLDMLYMNPGACGRHGWHHIRTVLRFTIAAGGLHDLEVVELGPRAGAAGAG